jgi:LacI family transcriptional regulator
LPTISDVAKRAGVSPVTVSRVINRAKHVNPTTRAKVQQAIKELGYVPSVVARSLRSRRTNIIGLMVPDITNSFWTALARGVEDSAQSHGYSVFLCNTDENPAKQTSCIEAFVGQRVDGIILAPHDSDAENLSLLRQRGTPSVVIDRCVHGWDVDSVCTDSVSGARVLVKHLIDLGHERIAMITGPLSTSTAEERVTGYCLALTEAGIPVDGALIKRGEFRSLSGEYLTYHVLEDLPDVTAIFAANNTIAKGVIEAMAKRGRRIPEDMALVCYDDFADTAAIFPFMTAIVQPAYEMGANAVQLLFSRLDSDMPIHPRHVALPTRLVKRYSCGRHLANGGEALLSLPIPVDEGMMSVLVRPLSAEDKPTLYDFGDVVDIMLPGRTGTMLDFGKPDVGRLLKVLQHQPADRIPHLDLQVHSRTLYEYVLAREVHYNDLERGIHGHAISPEDRVEFAQRLGMDAVVCNFRWRPNNVFETASDGSMQYVNGSIKSWADLDNLEPPPSPADQIGYLERYLTAAEGTGVGIIANFSSFFDTAMRAVGTLDALYLFYDDRHLLETLMDMIVEHQEKLVRTVCDRFGADLAFVMVNDEIAHNVGLMIRPDMFMDIFPHRMKRLIAPVKEHGKLTAFHTRGRMDKILPILADIGFDIISPVEPECNNVFALKEDWKGRMAFIGGIPTSLLAYGNWDKIETAAKEYCQRLCLGGGFALGAAGSVGEEIPPQNYTAMIEAIHRYGAYESVDAQASSNR